MRRICGAVAAIVLSATAYAGESSLTIYRDGTALVREPLSLFLADGVNHVHVNDITAFVEPSSVILRDPTGRVQLHVLEQHYRVETLNEALMLSRFEGETIEFRSDAGSSPVRGRIVRSGYRPGAMTSATAQPIVEVDGKLTFDLPGVPVFPGYVRDTVQTPELNWEVTSSETGKIDAEISYLTGKIGWEASYNVVAEPETDLLEIVGSVTVTNKSGKGFTATKAKLSAGDQNGGALEGYPLPRLLSVDDQQSTQMEFVRATGVRGGRVYVYETPVATAALESGSDSRWEKRVAVHREFQNTDANHLGQPLPGGRCRFYQTHEGELDVAGQSDVPQSANGATVRMFAGFAADLSGQKRITEFSADLAKGTADETVEIKLRSQRAQSVQVRVVEHLWRGDNWEIARNSDSYSRTDNGTAEFQVAVNAGQEKILTYRVHYTQLSSAKK